MQDDHCENVEFCDPKEGISVLIFKACQLGFKTFYDKS